MLFLHTWLFSTTWGMGFGKCSCTEWPYLGAVWALLLVAHVHVRFCPHDIICSRLLLLSRSMTCNYLNWPLGMSVIPGALTLWLHIVLYCCRARECRGSFIFYSCWSHFRFDWNLIFLKESPVENYPRSKCSANLFWLLLNFLLAQNLPMQLPSEITGFGFCL